MPEILSLSDIKELTNESHI